MNSVAMLPDAALGLTLAVIASSTAPILLLDDKLRIIGISDSFLRDFHIDAETTLGREIFSLGGGEWDVPQLRALLTSTLAGAAEVDAYEMFLQSPIEGRRALIINARNLTYQGEGGARLLVTVNDVTEAVLARKTKDDLLKEKDDLIQEKAILLQELQHRVANSLQIIASVILQSARKAHTEETRGYLRDAHNRVMSVAALQQQLSASTIGEVKLREYFTQLCASIAASMIRDPEQLRLRVEVDDSVVDTDASISLGLLVTELVINALKHAFPGGREGEIVVSYQSEGSAWTLMIRDDGVGMPTDVTSRAPGLGTSIVHALAHQLKASIRLTDGAPGTTIALIRAADADASMPDVKAV